MPRQIKKQWVQNVGKKGGTSQWLPHVDKCIVEMLSNRTSPRCVQRNMLVMARVIHPTLEVVKELPSLRYIQASRTVLVSVTKTLAAWRIGKSTSWRQNHIDETSRQHKSLLNLVMTVVQGDGTLKTICLSCAIIAKNSTAEEQARAIIGQLKESGRLLDQWRDMTKEMFPEQPGLWEQIPTSKSMCVSRMLRTQTATDTCNTAQAVQKELPNLVFSLCRDLGIAEDDLVMFSGYCYQHMRNIVANGVEIIMCTWLTELMQEDLEVIPRHLRVQCGLWNLASMVDKEINPRGQYAKGHSRDFWHFMTTYHEGATWLPVVRVNGGARQDGSFEAALPLYIGRKYIVQFLHNTLCSNKTDNILQTTLFVVLECVEMIAQVRVASIFFISVIVPWRWLAGKCHELGHNDWGEKDMSVICDLVYDAFALIEEDGEKLLDEEFIMNIFSPLYNQLPEFEEYLTWYFEEKASYPVGITNDEERILAMDEARAELFYPTQACNRQSNEFCHRLAENIGSRVCSEMEDPRKSLHLHLSKCDGEFSKKMTSEEVRVASIGMRANNDPSEQMFGCFSEAHEKGGGMGLNESAGQGQSWYNKDYLCGADHLVTGKRIQAEIDGEDAEPVELGLFHELPSELTDSLIAVSKKNAHQVRRTFNDSLKRQSAARELKQKTLRNNKLEIARAGLVDALYLHQQYDSPRCWKTKDQAYEAFEGMKWKKDRMAGIKEQILMRYLGLGWVEAHHPWSKKGHGTYSPIELLDHFVKVVLPLADIKTVPAEPPLELPGLPNICRLGTRAKDCIDLENSLHSEDRDFRMQALRERERLEDNGFGDQLMEMQQTLWPIESLRTPGFKVDKLFEYKVGDDYALQWCQGKVIEYISQSKNKHVIVKVEWNKDCLREGDPKITREKLIRSNWNPEVPADGAWREDLYHKIVKST